MRAINAIRMGGIDVLPLVEGGKGVSISNGISSGNWAAAGGVGTFSAVNADSFDDQGRRIPQLYHGRTRRERHEELVAYAIKGALDPGAAGLRPGRRQGPHPRQHPVGDGRRRTHHHRGAGTGEGHHQRRHLRRRHALPAVRHRRPVQHLLLSDRVLGARLQRAVEARLSKAAALLGGVVYEDPWLAGGHNGLSNSEDPNRPEDPYPRVLALRKLMREFGLHETPIIMAGGVWWLEEWENWIDNPELGPIAFQFGTRPLLTKESPIGDAWKERLLTLKEGDVFLNRFSPTGFYSSAVNNGFIQELRERSERQVAYTAEPIGEHVAEYGVGPRKRPVYLTPADLERARSWEAQGFTEALRTPDSTLIFVTPEKAQGDPGRPGGLHGLPVAVPVLQLVAARGRTTPPASGPIRAASASRRRCRTSRMTRRAGDAGATT